MKSERLLMVSSGEAAKTVFVISDIISTIDTSAILTRLKTRGGCIVNRVNGNNLQYKIKGDNKS